MFEAHLTESRRPIDWTLVAAVLGLMVIGAAFICSASFAREAAQGVGLFKKYYFKQIVYYAVGVGAVLGFCFLDYRSWARWSLVAYWASIITLALVFVIGTGSASWGAKRWINIGFGFQLQPAEFAKIAFIFAQANYLSRPPEELRQPSIFFKSLLMTAVPFVLILL